MSHRIDFVWHAPEGYWTLRSDSSLDSELETILVQSLVTDYWELLSEAKISIRRALKSYSR